MVKNVSCALITMLCAAFSASPLIAHEDHEVKNSPLDFAIVHVDTISRSIPVRVRDFDTDKAHLGKGKHRQEAEEMASVAPGRLTEDLLAGLEASGFQDVTIAKSGDALPESCLVIEGSFTVLNPGSTTKRVVWGFGAGKTQVCVRGVVLDAGGMSLGEFSHCRSGLGWKAAKPQMGEDAQRMGGQIARFLSDWADGEYSR